MRRLGGALAMAGVVAAACTPIRPIPFSNAPVNKCPCDDYESPAGSLAATCNGTTARCEIGNNTRPSYPFFVVIDVPSTATFGPGTTHVLYSSAFTTRPATTSTCNAPSCLSIGGLTNANGHYLVAATRSTAAGFPLKDGQAIPARVSYTRIGNPPDQTQPDFPSGLPLQPLVVFPQIGTIGAEFSATMPSGRYRAVMFPEPPFDVLFPPRVQESQDVDTSSFVDDFLLKDDPSSDASRDVTLTRAEGFDGWQTWLAQISASEQRISTLTTLKGATENVHYDVSGIISPPDTVPLFERRDANNQPIDDVELIVAPPASYIGVPRFITRVFSGSFGQPLYPPIPSPQLVRGVVAEPDQPAGAGPQLLGYPAHVSFESISIATLGTSPPSTLLRYATELDTDERGVFFTLIPPGSYNVTVEPAEGTGFAKSRQIAIVGANVVPSFALTLQPPRRTLVHGRVVLSDDRPLLEGEVVATPQTPTSPQVPKPRPARTTTQADGRFDLELDQGPYVLTAIPKDGSGFPRLVTLVEVPASETRLDDMRIPPPAPLTFTIRDRSQSQSPLPSALVRIFAIPGVSNTADFAGTSLGEPVEIGNARSGADGKVEILLAPGPL